MKFDTPDAGRMEEEWTDFSNLSQILDIPHIHTVIIVNHSHFVNQLVIGNSNGIWVFRFSRLSSGIWEGDGLEQFSCWNEKVNHHNTWATSTPSTWGLGRVATNWRVWGEKHLTMPPAHPTIIYCSPTERQLALDQTKWKSVQLTKEIKSEQNRATFKEKS